MLRAFLKDSAIYAIPAFISRGLSLILVPLYTRVLSPADYGSLDLLIVFAGIINLTIALEVSQGVARFYGSEQDPQRKVAYASSALWFTLVCYSVFALIMLAFTPQVAGLVMGQPGMELAFQIGIAFIWINSVFYLVQNQFRWELRSRHYAIVSLVMAFVTAGVSVWLAFVLKWGLLGLLVGMVVGCLVATALGFWWLRNSFRFRFSFPQLREMLKFSTPLVFSGIAVWVCLYVDRMMINHFLSINEVGLYGIGHRLASVAGLVMVGFQGALTPLVYAHYQKEDTPRQLECIFRIFLFLALTMFLLLTLFALDILRLLTTPAFYGGAEVVVYLVPAIMLANMYIFSPGISIAKKTHLIVWINVGGGMLNILLNYLFIPAFGITGAGLATMISYFCIFSAYTTIGHRFYRIPHQWSRPIGVVFVAAVLAWAVPHAAVSDLVRWALNLMALGIFAAAAFALGLVRRDEIGAGLRMLRERIGSKP
jgi:O-antigen/teichoic acid export membrane protein